MYTLSCSMGIVKRKAPGCLGEFSRKAVSSWGAILHPGAYCGLCDYMYTIICYRDSRFFTCSVQPCFPIPAMPGCACMIFSAARSAKPSGWTGGCSLHLARLRRVRPGRRLYISPRCAGLTLDVGADLPPPERERLRRLALRSGLFEFVLPEYAAPTWVGVQKRIALPCAPRCPFPELSPGERSVFVFALQDALAVQGFPSDGGLTGCFDASTERALRAFCHARKIPYCGALHAEIWNAL